MRHWLTFEALVEEMDSDGARVEVWADAFDVSPTMPAEVTPLSGREFWRSQQVQSDITHEVVIRYRPDVRHNQRIRYGDRTLNIESVIDTEEAGVELRLMCKEVV